MMTVTSNITPESRVSLTESFVPSRINIIAAVIEHLTEHRVADESALAEQANWLAVQIDERSDELSRVKLLAGIGLELSRGREEDDDMLGQELFFLFGEILEAAVRAEH